MSNRFGLDPENPNYHRALINRYRHKVRAGPERTAADQVKPDATSATLKRVKSSHQGIGQIETLEELAAVGANQDYLDEIGQLSQLQQLDLRYPFTASDLSPLRGLSQLRVLHIDAPSKIVDFSPLADLPSLEVLTIENARHLQDLECLTPLKDQLIVLGLEGSISTTQKLNSLAPLEGFAIEALFMVSTRLADNDITPLFSCPNLALLLCARMAPRAQFEALERRNPDLICNWFDWDMWPKR